MSEPTGTELFDSEAGFRDAFIQGLVSLMDDESLGNFILVAANAALDPKVMQATRQLLYARYEALAEEYRSAFAEGRMVNAPEDDLLVFLKLLCVGMDGLQTTKYRQEGPWELSFNQLRSFRPRRMGAVRVDGLLKPFDPQGFHFNRAYLDSEIFWEGELLGRKASLLYNKFPFVELHGLLVPEREACHAQFLKEDMHRYIWDVTEQLAVAIPDIGFGYNAIGAFASVNHLHFQMFVRPGGLPVMNPRWSHHGGDEDYPVKVLCLSDREQAWEALVDLHRRQQTYNLIYRPGCLYLFARRRQGDYEQPQWNSGFSWYEMAGGMLTFSREPFDTLSATDIETALGRLAGLGVD